MRKQFFIACLFLAGCSRTPPPPTDQPLAPQSAPATNLRWDAGGPEVAAYRVQYGPASGQYDQQQDVGLATTASINALGYFAVTAFNSNGIESAPSNEVATSGTPGPTITPAPTLTPGPTTIPGPTPGPTAIPSPTQIPGSLTLSPIRVNVLTGNGVDPATQIVSVTSSGSWQAVSNKPWLTVHCASGNCGGSFFILQITTLGLGTGSYSGSVTVTSGAVSTSLPVTLTIISPSNPSPTPGPTQKPKSTPEKK